MYALPKPPKISKKKNSSQEINCLKGREKVNEIGVDNIIFLLRRCGHII